MRPWCSRHSWTVNSPMPMRQTVACPADKGETATELAAAAAALRSANDPVPRQSDVLDTCGTGGDGRAHLTSARRSPSSPPARACGSSSMAIGRYPGAAAAPTCCWELGLPAEAGPDWSARCLQEVGLAFCFAPHFHPALTRFADLRRRLGVRTILNSLGPLANPAGAAYQLIGVGRPDMLDPLASAAGATGNSTRMVVCGADGFDEVSLTGPTLVRDVRGERDRRMKWTPADFGLEPCRLADLRVSDGARECGHDPERA